MTLTTLLALVFAVGCGGWAFYSELRLRRYRKQLDSILWIFAYQGRGVHKRIDEIRELSETLSAQCPEMMQMQPWVSGWLESQSHWLQCLAKQMGSAFPAIDAHNRGQQPRYRKMPSSDPS